ncbi:EamA/RhaT family transporter [Photobacterium kishitanii]|uniref:DMT family transporter n=1 Tax=Photobacterium kishitanii TaxID=318456 RepID=UPI0005D399C6|nr:DMT family transporter [Photobacterium kishitanii]KJG05142.1 multidrug transporter [Photobacterium kishitanii]PSV06626.1 EamA/RhaT family transporter [Photobacterium kishitanii]PSV77627.1 EamA/RhaT family transporter [Photobacterium kishitanii]
MLIKAIPFVFVILWASGFVGARFGLQYAEPATLLSIRMALNILLFLIIAGLLHRRIPTGKDFWHSCIAGLLIHGFYLGGSYFAISLGMPAGLSSLLVGIQPILTAIILLSLTQEQFKPSQWLGLLLGFIGITMVLMGKMEWQSELHKTSAFCFCLSALFGITLGTLYQKKYCQQIDMIGGATIQYLAALTLFLPIALKFETMKVLWTTEFILSLAWLVICLSCIALLLLLYMVNKNASSSVASMFYLVPPITAIQAWLIFGESFSWIGIVGFVLAASAVYLVAKKPDISILMSKSVKLKPEV